jgi:hypothetical protein
MKIFLELKYLLYFRKFFADHLIIYSFKADIFGILYTIKFQIYRNKIFNHDKETSLNKVKRSYK